jgi:hypothetical protein
MYYYQPKGERKKERESNNSSNLYLKKEKMSDKCCYRKFICKLQLVLLPLGKLVKPTSLPRKLYLV